MVTGRPVKLAPKCQLSIPTKITNRKGNTQGGGGGVEGLTASSLISWLTRPSSSYFALEMSAHLLPGYANVAPCTQIRKEGPRSKEIQVRLGGGAEKNRQSGRLRLCLRAARGRRASKTGSWAAQVKLSPDVTPRPSESVFFLGGRPTCA